MEQIDVMLNFDVKSDDAIAKFKDVYFMVKTEQTVTAKTAMLLQF